MATETQQEIVLLPELPPVPSRTEDEQATYNTKAFNFRAAERELQQKFNINVPLLNTVLKSSTDILPNMDAIENVSGNMVNITAVAAHSSDITTVAVNMPAVLDAPNAATAAGKSAQDAAASAGQAATSASDAATSSEAAAQSSVKAREWAEKAEDTPVETGKYSALHWAEKSRSAALTALGGIPLIEAGDDGKALVADGETLAWVKGPSFTATPAAGAVPKADASGKIAAGWIPPVAPAAHHTSHEPGGNDALTRFSGLLTEKVQNLGVISGTVTINLASGHYVVATVGGAVTINVSGAEPGVCTAVMLELDNAGSAAVTWGMTPTWAGGVAPSLTASGKDYVGLCSRGEGWAGVLVSSDAK